MSQCDLGDSALPFGPLAPACVAGDCWDGQPAGNLLRRAVAAAGWHSFFRRRVQCRAGYHRADLYRVVGDGGLQRQAGTSAAVETFEPLAHTACRTVGIQPDSGQNVWLRINARPFAPTGRDLGRAVPGDRGHAALGDPARIALAGRGALIRNCCPCGDIGGKFPHTNKLGRNFQHG